MLTRTFEFLYCRITSKSTIKTLNISKHTFPVWVLVFYHVISFKQGTDSSFFSEIASKIHNLRSYVMINNTVKISCSIDTYFDILKLQFVSAYSAVSNANVKLYLRLFVFNASKLKDSG